MYRQYEFRSRLEAKWAAFFDLCRWPWSYEPVDMNGWIPDFAIGERPILVEVKPFFHADEWGDTITKIVNAGCRQDVLLLGADPTWTAAANEYRLDYDGPVFANRLSIWTENGEVFCDSEEINFGVTEGNGELGLCAMDGAWSNLIWKAPIDSTHPNKWSRVSLNGSDVETLLVSRWATACNVSKWIPTKS